MTAVDMTQYGRSGESFKFTDVGDTLTGEIVQIKEPHVRQNSFTEQDETVMAVTVRQSDGEEYSIWPRLKPGSAMGGAIANACGLHGGKLTVGGQLAVQFTEELDTGKGNPAKLYACEYKPPARSVDMTEASTSLLGDDKPF